MIQGKGTGKESLFWVDAVKAVCMICVYWAHVEAYAGAHDFSPTHWFSPFYVNLFFFVSGYLFFRKVFDLSGSHQFSLKERVVKLFCILVWPTVLFSTLLYLPKILYHQGNWSLSHYAYNVLGGVSYWFTSALVVSQLLLLLFTKLRVSRFSVYFLFSVSLFFSGLWLTVYDDSPFFWYYKSGMGGVLFMALGGLYLQYEFQVDRYIGKVRYGLVVALYIVLIGFDVEGLGRSALMSMDFNLLGLLQSLLGFFVVVGLCKKMSEVRPLSYIGKHSIVFYFLSGVVPASLALVLRQLMPSSYMSNCLVFVLSLVASSIGALIIGRYLPFLLDIRRLGFLNDEK